MKSSWHLHEGDEIAPGLLAMSRLGGGHAYEAYLAWSERLYAHVVVKLVRPDQVDDPRTLRGLRREIAMLDRLDHPVVVRGFGHELEGPRPHVVLEHLDGPRLSTLIRKYGPLPMEQLLPLSLQLASALHYLAVEGVVHLDVKPSNVIMDSTPRLIDLSIARPLEDAAELDHVVGTDDYLAPEQTDPPHSGRPESATDVWGLGATLFYAASGYLPYDVKGAQERHGERYWPQRKQPPREMPDDLPDGFRKPVLRAMRRDPVDRPTARELASELEPLIVALPKPVLGGFKAR